MVLKALAKNRDLGLLVLRLGLGLTFIFIHGAPKLFGGPAKWITYGYAAANLGLNFWPEFWGFLCAATEFFGGILLVLGYKVRIACLFLIPNMIVAIFYMTKVNAANVSYPFEIMVVFIALFFLGSGKYGLEKD
jgi:putative oxidoreductase